MLEGLYISILPNGDVERTLVTLSGTMVLEKTTIADELILFSELCFDPYTYFSDLIVGETTCDGKKKMYELLGRLKPVYVLHLPQGREDYALDMWTGELRRFMAYLEERFGVTITDEALRSAARQRNAERRARLDLMAVQKLSPPPAFGQQLYTALDGAGFVFDPAQRVRQLEELRQGIMDAYQRGERPVPIGAKRIMVTGCPSAAY